MRNKVKIIFYYCSLKPGFGEGGSFLLNIEVQQGGQGGGRFLPIARINCPQERKIEQKFGERVNFGIIFSLIIPLSF